MARNKSERRSRAEVAAILRRLERSGKSLRAFGEEHGISANTLAFWTRRERLEGGVDPVAPSAERTTLVALAGGSSEPSRSFKVVFGDVVIRVPRDVSAREWRRLRMAWGS